LDLERSFGFLVNDVARLFGRRFDHNGRRLGLTRAQCRTLGYIARNEGINQAGLADLLEIRPMTLVRQIDRMEEAGWIERRPHPSDRPAGHPGQFPRVEVHPEHRGHLQQPADRDGRARRDLPRQRTLALPPAAARTPPLIAT